MEPADKQLLKDVRAEREPHRISVCITPVCSVLGQDMIVEKLEELLGIPCGSMSEDATFLLERSECQGFCELAPMIRIDGITFEDINPEDLPALLNQFRLSVA